MSSILTISCWTHHKFHLSLKHSHGYIGLLLLCLLVTTTSSSIEAQRYQSLPSTVFAPTGRLYKVEQNAKSTSDIHDVSSPLSLALHCENSKDDDETNFVLVLSTRPVSPHLHLTTGKKQSASPKISDSNFTQDESYYAPLYLPHIPNRPSTPFLTNSYSPFTTTIGSSLVAVTGGNAVDSIILLQRIKEMAISLLHATTTTTASNQYKESPLTTAILARRLADAAQISTQTLGGRSGRMLKSAALLIGPESPISPNQYQIWRIDPTGQFWNCHAAAIGRGAGLAEQLILRKVVSWKKRMECETVNAVEIDANGDNDNDERDDNKDEEEEMISLLSSISNQDVYDYLGTLNQKSALTLAMDIVSKVLFKKTQDTAVNLNPKDDHNEEESAEWIQCRDLHCIIVDATGKRKMVVLDNFEILKWIKSNTIPLETSN